MASEFEVPFLGSVPIDPMFIRLVEEGKRPIYPEGTIVQGRDMQVSAATNGDSNESDLLVEKYTDCSLCPIFEAIVKQLFP